MSELRASNRTLACTLAVVVGVVVVNDMKLDNIVYEVVCVRGSVRLICLFERLYV